MAEWNEHELFMNSQWKWNSRVDETKDLWTGVDIKFVITVGHVLYFLI